MKLKIHIKFRINSLRFSRRVKYFLRLAGQKFICQAPREAMGELDAIERFKVTQVAADFF